MYDLSVTLSAVSIMATQLNPTPIRFTLAEREKLQAEAIRRGITRHNLIRLMALSAIQSQEDLRVA
jgi:hypothetical protein